ncbi:choice-of-anchor A family protein [Leucobacter viscericola]|uniref:Choice-of-anchor A family protein n=1 Tax=Leucobacter viscericola TaxID=2714935 RepID=A0A6G7XIS5_9MICO|nr:choice-of-anchor A family protein [Leucobacter viscericola]QIK64386.1 choice-of-anchor A family protein [Leucobacter viscericola]
MRGKSYRGIGRRIAATVLVAGLGIALLPGITPAGAVDPDNFLPGPCEGPLCPSGDFPPTSDASEDQGYRDEAVNIFAGGNIEVSGAAAEMEGKIVTLGDFTQNKGPEVGYRGYNVGRVGKGSQVQPPSGSDFLTVGGKFSLAAGNTIWSSPGVIRYAEAGDIQGNVDSPWVRDPEAAAAYRGVVPGLTARSLCLATQPVTGTAQIAAGVVRFAGDGASMRQVFEVKGSIPESGSSPLNGVQFTGVPDGATVIVNMTGVSPQIITNGGSVDDSSQWNKMRSRLLWNFPNATSVALRGFQQFQGSVLIGNPGSTTQVSVPGLAGRFFTAGSIRHVSEPGFGGAGGEFHSYPFLGSLPDCSGGVNPIPPETNISIQKTWVVNGQSYADGEQPYGLSAVPQLDGTSVTWGTKQAGKTAGNSVVVGETMAGEMPALCTLDSSRLTVENGTEVDKPIPHTMVLAEGDNSVTITNTVSCRSRINLVKQVVGGKRTPSEWKLVVTPKANILAGDKAQTVVGSDQGVSVEVNPGTTYELSETGPLTDYHLSSLRCNVGDSGAYIDVTEVTPGARDNITCIFVNSVNDPAIPPLKTIDSKLTLVKVVDNGKTQKRYGPTDWTLHAVGSFDHVSGTSGSDEASEVPVNEGTYQLSEEGPRGYTASPWVCKGARSSTATSVTVGKGDHAVCTVTNTAEPDDNRSVLPKLTLIKKVDNGTSRAIRTPQDWTLHAAGPQSLEGVSADRSVTEVEVKAGTYKLSETGPRGYKASDWKCEGATKSTATSVTVAAGDHAVCTVTNTVVSTETGSKGPKSQSGPLARTGSGLLISAALIGIGLTAAGVLIVRGRRSA